MSNCENMACGVYQPMDTAEKRETVIIGERLGKLINKLSLLNGDAGKALYYLGGHQGAVTEAACCPLPPKGFIFELSHALDEVDREVAELQHTIDRLGNL